MDFFLKSSFLHHKAVCIFLQETQTRPSLILMTSEEKSVFQILEKMGNALKNLRLRKELSQEQLAMSCGLDRAHLSAIESGKHGFGVNTLAKVLVSMNAEVEYFELLLDSVKAVQDLQKAKGDTNTEDSQPPLALIVEDEAITGENLRQNLEGLGFQVLGPIASSDTAFRLAVKSKPKLAVLDIRLRSKSDGIELGNKLRETLPDCKIIFVTAYSDPQTLDRARLVKPNGYLLKPFTERQLLAVVNTINLAS